MFSNHSKYVVASGFAAIMVLMTAVIAVGYSRMTDSAHTIEQLVDVQNRKTNLVLAMYRAVRERSLLLLRMAHTADPFERDRYFLRAQEEASRYIAARQALSELLHRKEEKALYAKLRQLTTAATSLHQRVVDLLAEERPAEAMSVLVNEAIPARAKVLHLMEDMLEFQQRTTSEALAAARMAYRDTLHLLVLMILAALGIGLAITVVVIRKISKAEDALVAEVTLQSIDDAVITTDASGHISYINGKAAVLTGHPSEFAVGKPFASVFQCFVTSTPHADIAIYDTVTNHDRTACQRGEATLISADGRHMIIDYSVSPIGDRGNGKLGSVVVFRDISERKQMIEQLRKSEERFALVMRGTNDGIWDYNLETGQIYFSPRWTEMLGYREGEFGNSFRAWQDIIHPDDLGKALVTWTDCMNGSRESFTIEYRMRTRDNRWKWIQCRGLASLVAGRAPVRLAGSHTDITERKLAEQALFEAKEHAEVTLHSIGDAVITVDTAGCVTYMNPVAVSLSGWPAGEAVGTPVGDVIRIVDEDAGHTMEDLVKQCLQQNTVVTHQDQIVLISRNGTRHAIQQTAAPIRNRKGIITGVVTVLRDVTTERTLKKELYWQATHDRLTGLINRTEFEQQLDNAIRQARQTSVEHALLYLDLDQFKVVNDTCGHVAGDELLRQLANLLGQQVRSADTLARLGGDEFGVLLKRCQIPKAMSIAHVLRETIKDFRFAWDNKTFEIGVSIGVVPITSSSGSRNELLSAADIACYAAKDLGRNRVHLYEQNDNELALRHKEMRWVSRITKALQEDRFVLYRQIITPLLDPSGSNLHQEILVRMLDENGKLVPPGAFIPAAERYNLMPAIDRWVIRTLFAAIDGMYDPAAAGGPVFTINLSGTSVNEEGFMSFIHDQFRRFDINPANICFEITETSAIANLSHASEFIRETKEMGCLFALDDFGSGLSSFGYLKNLPVDYLKIDGQFVKDLVEDPIDEAMVRSINDIGHVMGMQTIAEFVENEAILRRLTDIGVDYAQGYGIAMPEPLSLLTRGRAASR